MSEAEFGPEFNAAVNLLRRTGMTGIQIRYQDELEPVVWIIVTEHAQDERKHFTPFAALHPMAALMGACEVLIDGGECMDCGKTTTFIPPHEHPLPAIFREPLCFIEFDAATGEFERRH